VREGTFSTPSKRARFTVHPLPAHDLTEDQLLLTTLRSHDQFNTTIYGEDDRYRGIYGGRRVVFLNAEDMRARGIAKDQAVDLVSHFGAERRRAEGFRAVPYEIPRGCAAAYYPETNVLVPVANVADGSNQPASKSIVVTLEHA
jgi:anaerobic selenocysteine-containing dehydrogenase